MIASGASAAPAVEHGEAEGVKSTAVESALLRCLVRRMGLMDMA